MQFSVALIAVLAASPLALAAPKVSTGSAPKNITVSYIRTAPKGLKKGTLVTRPANVTSEQKKAFFAGLAGINEKAKEDRNKELWVLLERTVRVQRGNETSQNVTQNATQSLLVPPPFHRVPSPKTLKNGEFWVYNKKSDKISPVFDFGRNINMSAMPRSGFWVYDPLYATTKLLTGHRFGQDNNGTASKIIENRGVENDDWRAKPHQQHHMPLKHFNNDRINKAHYDVITPSLPPHPPLPKGLLPTDDDTIKALYYLALAELEHEDAKNPTQKHDELMAKRVKMEGFNSMNTCYHHIRLCNGMRETFLRRTLGGKKYKKKYNRIKKELMDEMQVEGLVNLGRELKATGLPIES